MLCGDIQYTTVKYTHNSQLVKYMYTLIPFQGAHNESRCVSPQYKKIKNSCKIVPQRFACPGRT